MLMPSILSDNFIDDMFDSFFTRPTKEFNNYANLMQTDVKDDGKNYVLEMALPGYDKNDIKAELKNGYLTINAEHTTNVEDKKEDEKYIRKERYTGRCSRTFYVGDELSKEDINAKFENGVLILNLPKHVEKPEIEENNFISIAG